MTIVPAETLLMFLALVATLLTIVGFVSLFSFSIYRGRLQKKRRLEASGVRQVIGIGLSAARHFSAPPKEAAVETGRLDRARGLSR